MGVFSYLITIFAVVFWGFRLITVFLYSMGINFVVIPMDVTTEIIVLFIALFTFIFIIKRNILGTLIYFSAYGWYFGTHIYNALVTGEVNEISFFVAVLGIIIASLNLIDVLFNKNRRNISKHDTNWFYKNKRFDRNYDERADKNQYKF